jgi:hypothetical protein
MTVLPFESNGEASALLSDRAKLLDVRPLLERKSDNIWAHVERIRDELYNALVAICADEGIDALTIKSNHYEHPPWVKFECWLPKRNRYTTERASVIIYIIEKPYHDYQIEFKVDLHDRGNTKEIAHLKAFGEKELRELIRYLLRRGKKPSFRHLQLRDRPIQLWREKNRIENLQFDYQNAAMVGMAIATIIAFVSDIPGLGLLLAIGTGLLWWWLSRRPILILSAGKPIAEPRRLRWVDSWQTVIFDLGTECETVQQRFLEAIEKGPTENYRAGREKIWYWGLDGKEEREQIVLSMSRVLLFCQIQRYGKDLYVGWNAHLNTAQWAENKVAQGFSRDTGQVTSINTVSAGTQQLTDYDLSDLNCLIEWTHSQLVQLIKRIMAEKKLDQEIDFKILRGERQQLTAGAGDQKGTLEGVKNVMSRLRRVD